MIFARMTNLHPIPIFSKSKLILMTQSKTFSRTSYNYSKKSKRKTLKEEFRSKYKNVFVREEDINKRPSDLEIKQKELPLNQPTLGERMNRDVYRLFYQADEKHGYHNLRKFPDSMKTEVVEDVKEQLNRNPKKAFSDAFKSVRNEIREFAREMKEADFVSAGLDKLPPLGQSCRPDFWEVKTED